MLLLAVALSLGLLFPAQGSTSHEAAPLRLALHLSDGSGLVLYSGAEQARFLDNSDDRPPATSGRRERATRSRTAAIVRSLSGGPFHVDAALVHAASPRRHATDGPLPGDQALVSFPVFTTAGLGDGRRVGGVDVPVRRRPEARTATAPSTSRTAYD